MIEAPRYINGCEVIMSTMTGKKCQDGRPVFVIMVDRAKGPIAGDLGEGLPRIVVAEWHLGDEHWNGGDYRHDFFDASNAYADRVRALTPIEQMTSVDAGRWAELRPMEHRAVIDLVNHLASLSSAERLKICASIERLSKRFPTQKKRHKSA